MKPSLKEIRELESPQDRFRAYWQILEDLLPKPEPKERKKEPKPAALLPVLAPKVARIPPATRESLLHSTAVDRLVQSAGVFSAPKLLGQLGLTPNEFQKAKTTLNRFRGHVGGSGSLGLDALKGVLVFLLMVAEIHRRHPEEQWIRDLVEAVEPFLRSVVETLEREVHEWG